MPTISTAQRRDHTAFDASRVRAITIDLDDTLWPVWPAIERAETVLRGWLAERAPRTAALLDDRERVQQARRAVVDSDPSIRHDLGAIRRELLRRLMRQAGDDPALAEPAFDVFYAERLRVALFDDALPALTFLRSRFRVVALSNGNADVHRIGIGHLFHGVVNAAGVGAAKPEVRIFEAGAAAAGVAPEAVLHVGDDAALDVAGAHAAGMQTAWINRAGHAWPHTLPQPPHLHVADLAALCAALGQPAT